MAALAALAIGVAVNWNLFFVAFYVAVAFTSVTVLIFLNPLWLAIVSLLGLFRAVQRSFGWLDNVFEKAAEALKEEKKKSE